VAAYNGRVRPAHLVLLAALGLGCGGGQHAAQTGPPAFEWAVSQGLWGDERLTIGTDGAAHYHFVSARGEPTIDRTAALDAGELEPLRAATRLPAFCALRSERDGIPDEGQPTLVVRTGERDCTVTLWDGEWDEMPAARPAHDAIGRIIRRLKGR